MQVWNHINDLKSCKISNKTSPKSCANIIKLHYQSKMELSLINLNIFEYLKLKDIWKFKMSIYKNKNPLDY